MKKLAVVYPTHAHNLLVGRVAEKSSWKNIKKRYGNTDFWVPRIGAWSYERYLHSLWGYNKEPTDVY